MQDGGHIWPDIAECHAHAHAGQGINYSAKRFKLEAGVIDVDMDFRAGDEYVEGVKVAAAERNVRNTRSDAGVRFGVHKLTDSGDWKSQRGAALRGLISGLSSARGV
jgi:hypothetical protein